ncbi:MAG: ThuA domain-containing protein [Pirellulaceae bacterium]
MMRSFPLLVFLLLATFAPSLLAQPVVYEGDAGPGRGKHLVFLAGDHEYRSEETLPALARILAKHYGFKCTVLFSVNPESGELEPGSSYMPGTETLASADLMVIFLRFQDFPAEQMQPIVDYLARGGPVVGLRTSTHAFKIPGDSQFARYSYNHAGDDMKGGFGRQILGETWAGHYGKNHVMSTRLDLAAEAKDHPILRGVENAHVQAGGYWTEPMADSEVLALAQPLDGMTADSPPAQDKLPCPGAWVRSYTGKSGKSGRVFTTTYGASEDLLNDGFRRMMVNACLWAAGLEDKIHAESSIEFVGPYQPTTFRFGGYRKGVKPSMLDGWESPILPIVEADADKEADKEESKPRRQGAKQQRLNNKQKKAAADAAPADAAPVDAKNLPTGKAEPVDDPKFQKYGIYQHTAPRAKNAPPVATTLPLILNKGARIGLIGNTLLERSQLFGYVEAAIHASHPRHELIVRNLAWPADTSDLQPRPENFADVEQHLRYENVDVILAAYGFNESFAGEAGLPAFRESLAKHVASLKSKAFNGESAPQIVLLSPIANENVAGVPAADMNNERIMMYAEAVREVAAEQRVGYVDIFTITQLAMRSPGTDLTINGAHLNEAGYVLLADVLHQGLFGQSAPKVNERLRRAVVEKNRQYLRRYRPLNTFYYTGGRNKSYGYLDFLPAMRNFEILTANREQHIWTIARGEDVTDTIDDSNLPPLPKTKESRGANEWITAVEEQKAFQVDPRFEANLFAGEEEFPDIAAPIQMRWDSRGRLWVSCSTTYPHVYPGNEPNDKLVILEDTDGDGRADKSSVFADDLNIPLSFEFGDGGVYVSEMPHLTFLRDTDGDGKADDRRHLLTGFGTEDSHHALHDFAWTPDGDLIFRESIFHHSQVETPYGPVRQQNSGWFRFEPKTQRLTSFGTYHSTNPWGVTFDDWGQHVASHPIYAQAFHSLDPPYPNQHPKPAGLRAYSGTCGQEFVDFASFPEDLQGGFIKVRYKPTNRVEIHKWNEYDFGYDEEYVGDLIFSTNLSFIPVDLRFGPRGAMYVCDWYNPIKGHAQYSLRDERRDRHSGRIWRITAKGLPLIDPPKIADASIPELLEILKRPEYRYRYWAKRELREKEPLEVKRALDKWAAALDRTDPRFRHHQIEAVWAYRNVDGVNADLLRELLFCDDHHARAAATHQLRNWHAEMPDAIELLRRSANDTSGIVRMEAAIAASYIGTKEALDAMLDVLHHPRDGHLAYAITCALGSESLRRHWEGDPSYRIEQMLKQASRKSEFKEPTPSAQDAQFDSQKNLKTVRISCIPERMLFTVNQFAATVGQPVKIVFTNPDATDHNLVVVRPGALEEVGMAANEMAKDPRNSNSDFHPPSKKHLMLHASPMIGPTRKSQIHVMRFLAPTEPGVYPYVCTFPGHWVVMKGVMVVAEDLADVEAMLAALEPEVVQQWTTADFNDFAGFTETPDETMVVEGMQAFMKARCHQCHKVAGHGVNLGPDLADVAKRYQGTKLLRQLLQPSAEINEKFRNHQFLMSNGRVVTGVIVEETPVEYHVATNLLTPQDVTKLKKKDVDEKIASSISPMPEGLLNVLERDEILKLVAFLEAGGFKLPEHLQQPAERHGEE